MHSSHRSLRLSAALVMLVSCLATPVAAGWPVSPSAFDPFCVPTTGGYKSGPVSTADGAGGAYFVWTDARYGYPSVRVFAQHMRADGTAAWGDSGMPVCAVASVQNQPLAVSDGRGGFIVAWTDFRADTAGDLWAQDVAANGSPRWAASGVPVCSVPLAHTRGAVIAADGAGGALVAWQDDRISPVTPQVYAQRLDANGTALWTTDGVRACPTTDGQQAPVIDADGTGGAVLGWTSATWRYEVFAQRLDANGAGTWAAGGVTLNSSAAGAWLGAVAGTGDGGATFAWLDNRSNNSWQQIFVQRVGASGAVQWATDGVNLSGSTWPYYGPHLVPLAGGDVLVEWHDYENNGINRVFAQRLDAAGASPWGAPITAAVSIGEPSWFGPSVIADGAGGMLCAYNTTDGIDWSAWQIRAQRVSGAGALPWGANGSLLCSAADVRWSLATASDGAHGAIVGWIDARNGFSQVEYDAAQVGANGTPGATALAVPPALPPHSLALSAPWPNPARRGNAVAFDATLPAGARARLAILDVGGRLVRTLLDGRTGAASTAARWDGRDAAGHVVAAGLYFARLDAGGANATRRLVVAP